ELSEVEQNYISASSEASRLALQYNECMKRIEEQGEIIKEQGEVIKQQNRTIATMQVQVNSLRDMLVTGD
ncbi:hypothetical protein N9137_03270, partial [Pseudomonadales bacterium]|nr:hypothetical protein [Pseudomonadales bacterium]